MEAKFRRAAGNIVDGENGEAQRNVFDVAFGQSGKPFAHRARSCSDKDERFDVLANEIDFTFSSAAWREISGNKHSALDFLLGFAEALFESTNCKVGLFLVDDERRRKTNRVFASAENQQTLVESHVHNRVT